MHEIKLPKTRQISTLKKTYKGGLKGISLYEDRPDGAGEEYLIGRAELLLGWAVCISAGDSKNEDLAEDVNLLMAHRLALKDLMAEDGLKDMSEENKDKINKLIEKSGRGIELIDLNSVEKTRLAIRHECLSLIEKPKNLRISKTGDKKQEEQSKKIGRLAKGMQIKKIRDKSDLTIYNVHHYNSLLNGGDKSVSGKLNKALFDACELSKLSSWILKTRGETLYPITKFWIESRLVLLNRIVTEYF